MQTVSFSTTLAITIYYYSAWKPILILPSRGG